VQRRDFLAAAVSLPALPLLPAADKLGDIGLATITVAKGMTTNPAATFEAIAEIGYTELGLSQLYGHPIELLATQMKAVGLRCPVLHLPWADMSEASFPAALERCHMLGARYLFCPSLPAAKWTTRAGISEVAEVFNVQGAKARAEGVILGFHNHAAEFALVDGVPAFARFVAETDRELMQLELDCYWVTKAGHDPVAWLRRNPGRVPALHIKDMAMGGGFADVGAGTIDWPRIFRERARAGVRHVLVEHDQPKDELASARASFRYLRGLRWSS
jgi:sugar phosphate isomerase/epimerase